MRRERERESERARERQRERERERERKRKREKERERESKREKERESKIVCVCGCVGMWVCVWVGGCGWVYVRLTSEWVATTVIGTGRRTEQDFNPGNRVVSVSLEASTWS